MIWNVLFVVRKGFRLLVIDCFRLLLSRVVWLMIMNSLDFIIVGVVFISLLL